MSDSKMQENEILLRDDVMKWLRYTGVSAFHRFFTENKDFPRPFKIGRRNAWYRDDIQSWLDSKRKAAAEK